MIGQHAVTVYPDATLTGGADLSCLIDTLTVTHGRDDTGSQPEASAVSIDLTTDLDPLPLTVEIGAYLKVTTTTAARAYTRFLGRITDIALGWQEAGEDTPDMGLGKLTAVGNLADLGRKVVGDAPFPQELDGARVARVLALAGVNLDPGSSDPGTVQILPRDIDSQPALDVAQGTAASSGGLVWETATGEIRYADAMHRKGIGVGLSLDACDLFVTPTWRRTLAGLVNEVSIGYGAIPSGGEQPRYVAANDASKAAFGRYGYTTATELAALADASAMGQLLLVRNGSPVWIMSGLPVDTEGLDDARYDQLLALDVHSLVNLTGLPAIGAAPTTATLWVEGWKETFAYGSHVIELVVSGYCRTVPAPRWDDVDPGWLWGGQTITEQRRNYITNPGFEVSAAGWSAYTGVAAPTRSAVNPYSGAGRLDAVGSGASTAPRVAYSLTGMVAGDKWTVSARVRRDGVWPAGGTAYVSLRMQTLTAEVVTGLSPPWVPDANGWMLLTVTATVPPDTNGTLYVNLGAAGLASALTAAGSLGVDEVLLEKSPGPAGSYFDGDTPDTPTVAYDWLGPVGLSASTQSGVVSIPGGVSPDLTWDALTCLGPPVGYGRWNDVPASSRWDQTPPATTWDTWKG